jgi:hypothetical protein
MDTFFQSQPNGSLINKLTILRVRLNLTDWRAKPREFNVTLLPFASGCVRGQQVAPLKPVR